MNCKISELYFLFESTYLLIFWHYLNFYYTLCIISNSSKNPDSMLEAEVRTRQSTLSLQLSLGSPVVVVVKALVVIVVMLVL